MSRSRLRSITVRLAVTAVVLAGAAAGAAATSPTASATSTLVVDANSPYRTVTHVASGALYGLDTATDPADSLVEPLHPNTFVQMAPGGSQLPNGESVPGGDALVVAPEAAAAGAKVVVRMPDWYPNFPYVWVSWSNWLSAVDTQVKAVLASGDKQHQRVRAVERARLDLGHRRRRFLHRRLGPHVRRGPGRRPERRHPGPELLDLQRELDDHVPDRRQGERHGAEHPQLARARRRREHPGRRRQRQVDRGQPRHRPASDRDRGVRRVQPGRNPR